MLVSRDYVNARYNAMDKKVRRADLYDPASEPHRKKVLSSMKRAKPHHVKAVKQNAAATAAFGVGGLSGLAGMAAHASRGRVGRGAALGYAGLAGGAAMGLERGVRSKKSSQQAVAHLRRSSDSSAEIARLERRALVKRTTGASPTMSKSWGEYVSQDAKEAHRYLNRSARRDQSNTVNAGSQVAAGAGSATLGTASMHAARKSGWASPRKRLAVAAVGGGLTIVGGATAVTGVQNLRGGRESWKRSKVYRGKAAKIEAAGERRERAAVGKSDVNLFEDISKGLIRTAAKRAMRRGRTARRGTVVTRNGKQHYRRGNA